VRNPYEVLQVSQNAEPEVIDAAYRRLARKYHPDTSSHPDAHSRMQELNWAYEILNDPVSRSRYDRSQQQAPPYRRAAQAPPQAPPPGTEPSHASARPQPHPAPQSSPKASPRASLFRRYWYLPALALFLYLLISRSNQSALRGSVSSLDGSPSEVNRPSSPVDPYADCIPWTEAGLHDGETVCVTGVIVVVTYHFDTLTGADVWTAHFSFDSNHDFTLISVDTDISNWQSHCVAVYGRLFDRSKVFDYVTDSQPSMINSDPYVSRAFTITEAPSSVCR
jgi:hypothetical protein